MNECRFLNSESPAEIEKIDTLGVSQFSLYEWRTSGAAVTQSWMAGRLVPYVCRRQLGGAVAG